MPRASHPLTRGRTLSYSLTSIYGETSDVGSTGGVGCALPWNMAYPLRGLEVYDVYPCAADDVVDNSNASPLRVVSRYSRRSLGPLALVARHNPSQHARYAPTGRSPSLSDDPVAQGVVARRTSVPRRSRA
jgi:hypothetical protein